MRYGCFSRNSQKKRTAPGAKRSYESGGRVTELPLILVVEDEYLLATDIQRALTEVGFAAEIVSSGEEALALLDDDKPRSVLITDIRLGGRLSGWDLARHLRVKNPSLAIVYVTANDQDWPSHGVPNSILVCKPFVPAQLINAVSTLLNIGTPSTGHVNETASRR